MNTIEIYDLNEKPGKTGQNNKKAPLQKVQMQGCAATRKESYLVKIYDSISILPALSKNEAKPRK